MSARLRAYLRSVDGVIHTTLNPYQANAIRLHLIPPAKKRPGVPWALILNGQDILPLNTSWAILLAELIRAANRRAGKPIDAPEMDRVVAETLGEVRRIFPRVNEKLLRTDLSSILGTILEIGRGKSPDVDTGYMTLAKYAPNMRAPHRMDLMVSAMRKGGCWNCNQKCLNCYAADQPLGETPELGTEDWKRVIDRCRDAWISQLTFTGGEPTLRGDLVDLVAHASWFVTRLNTNGVLLTRELCDQLMEASLDSVQITLYSAHPEVHNALVGANQFHNTVAGIRNAVAAGLNVSVNTPLCVDNCDYVATLQFARELDVRYFSCSGLIPAGAATRPDSSSTRLDHDRLLALLHTAVRWCAENGAQLSFTSPGWLRDAELRALQLNVPACGACLSNMAVAPDGSVVPCQSWLSGAPLGNMLRDRWDDIWKGSACAAIRERAADSAACLLGEEVRR